MLLVNTENRNRLNRLTWHATTEKYMYFSEYSLLELLKQKS